MSEKTKNNEAIAEGSLIHSDAEIRIEKIGDNELREHVTTAIEGIESAKADITSGADRTIESARKSTGVSPTAFQRIKSFFGWGPKMGDVQKKADIAADSAVNAIEAVVAKNRDANEKSEEILLRRRGNIRTPEMVRQKDQITPEEIANGRDPLSEAGINLEQSDAKRAQAAKTKENWAWNGVENRIAEDAKNDVADTNARQNLSGELTRNQVKFNTTERTQRPDAGRNLYSPDRKPGPGSQIPEMQVRRTKIANEMFDNPNQTPDSVGAIIESEKQERADRDVLRGVVDIMNKNKQEKEAEAAAIKEMNETLQADATDNANKESAGRQASSIKKAERENAQIEEMNRTLEADEVVRANKEYAGRLAYSLEGFAREKAQKDNPEAYKNIAEIVNVSKGENKPKIEISKQVAKVETKTIVNNPQTERLDAQKKLENEEFLQSLSPKVNGEQSKETGPVLSHEEIAGWNQEFNDKKAAKVAVQKVQQGKSSAYRAGEFIRKKVGEFVGRIGKFFGSGVKAEQAKIFERAKTSTPELDEFLKRINGQVVAENPVVESPVVVEAMPVPTRKEVAPVVEKPKEEIFDLSDEDMIREPEAVAEIKQEQPVEKKLVKAERLLTDVEKLSLLKKLKEKWDEARVADKEIKRIKKALEAADDEKKKGGVLFGKKVKTELQESLSDQIKIKRKLSKEIINIAQELSNRNLRSEAEAYTNIEIEGQELNKDEKNNLYNESLTADVQDIFEVEMAKLRKAVGKETKKVQKKPLVRATEILDSKADNKKSTKENSLKLSDANLPRAEKLSGNELLSDKPVRLTSSKVKPDSLKNAV